MGNSRLVRKVQMECPLCDKIHELEERTRVASTMIKGEVITYEEIYYFCPNSDEDENEFVTGKMENSNLLNARNAYRKAHGLLTSEEIVAIREKYGLSQVDLAKLLGWGEATISRYESKAIQDEAYDNMLRIVCANSLDILELLKKNEDKFAPAKREQIKKKIMKNVDEAGREFIARQSLKSEYIDYQYACDENGYCILDIDKLETTISFFAKRVSNLYKVKLMKMLWYADVLLFKQRGRSMTGLVYCHEAMGALPVGHYKIVGLEEVKKQDEEGIDYTKYHFLANNNINENVLSVEEKDVLDKVVGKFKPFNAQEIVAYMHEETAYKETVDKQVIPFSVAQQIRDF